MLQEKKRTKPANCPGSIFIQHNRCGGTTTYACVRFRDRLSDIRIVEKSVSVLCLNNRPIRFSCQSKNFLSSVYQILS